MAGLSNECDQPILSQSLNVLKEPTVEILKVFHIMLKIINCNHIQDLNDRSMDNDICIPTAKYCPSGDHAKEVIG